MKRRLMMALMLLPSATMAAAPQTVPVARSTGGSLIEATPTFCVNADNSPCTTSSSASVGGNGSTAPTSSDQTGGRNPATGNLVPNCVDAAGVYCSPVAGTANRVITKTALAANTSTIVCPANAGVVATEIIASAGSAGIGLNGQTLNTATLGTATTAPDVPMATANTYYLPPVSPSNGVSAYSGTAQVFVCIQTQRQ